MKRFIYLLSAILMIGMTTTSCTTVEPGDEGFYNYYSAGVDTAVTETNGTHWHAPWTDMITMSVRQEAIDYDNAGLKDADGVKLTVDYSAGIRAIKGKTPKLYLLHGDTYVDGFVQAKVTSAVKDVFGKYSYVDILGAKRDIVEDEIEALISIEFEGNFITLDYVEIMDIQLPNSIQDQITAKETQEQRNLTAEKKKAEEGFLADARIEKSRGDSSLLVSSRFEAEAIEEISKQIAKSPSYIEYIKWAGFADGKGSPFGENNVFGTAGILKQIK